MPPPAGSNAGFDASSSLNAASGLSHCGGASPWRNRKDGPASVTSTTNDVMRAARNTPATFHEVNLVYDLGEDAYAVSGIQFPGAFGLIQGCNDRVCWGSTVNPLDVSDVFLDEVLRNALTLPTHTVHSGNPEPLQHIYQSFFVNVVGDGTRDNLTRANIGIDAGGISFVSPRRNNCRILGFSGGKALTNQYTGAARARGRRRRD